MTSSRLESYHISDAKLCPVISITSGATVHGLFSIYEGTKEKLTPVGGTQSRRIHRLYGILILRDFSRDTKICQLSNTRLVDE